MIADSILKLKIGPWREKRSLSSQATSEVLACSSQGTAFYPKFGQKSQSKQYRPRSDAVNTASDQGLHWLPLIQQFYRQLSNFRTNMVRNKSVPIFRDNYGIRFFCFFLVENVYSLKGTSLTRLCIRERSFMLLFVTREFFWL